VEELADDLGRELDRIRAELSTIGPALPGGIVDRWTRCGKSPCRCKADPPQLHGPYPQWTRKEKGKTTTRLLSPGQIERYRPLFEEAQRLRELVRELEMLCTAAVENAEGWLPPVPRAEKLATTSKSRSREPS
jgi:hypothetical protein